MFFLTHAHMLLLAILSLIWSVIVCNAVASITETKMAEPTRRGYPLKFNSLILLNVIVALLSSHGLLRLYKIDKEAEVKISYAKGVNHALVSFMLLNLEQSVTGTERSYGQMAELICWRLNVKYNWQQVMNSGEFTNTLAYRVSAAAVDTAVQGSTSEQNEQVNGLIPPVPTPGWSLFTETNGLVPLLPAK